MKIMNEIFSKIVNDGLTFKWLVLGVIIFLFGINKRNELLKESIGLNTSLNKWDLFLSTISDLYIILYLIFPLLLFIMVSIITKDFQHTILIRIGSYRKWIFRSQKKFITYLFLTMLVWILISLLISLGVPYSNSWSEFSTISNSISGTLQLMFTKPLFASVLQILSFMITTFLIHTLLSFLYVIFKNKVFISSVSVFLYLGAIISFKILPPTFKWIALPNYLSLYHGVSSFNSASISIFTIFILTISMVILVLKVDYNFQIIKNFFYFKIGIIVYTFLCLIGIIETAKSLINENITILDVLVQTFLGNASYISYLYYIIVFFGFMYFVQVFLEKELSELSYYKIIRFKSLNKWFLSWSKKIFVSVFLFLGLLLLITFSVSFAYGFNTTFKSEIYTNLSAITILYHFFINGFLQLTFYILLACIVSWSTREVTHSLIVTGLLIVLMLPGLSFLPVGLNGFNYIINDESIYQISLFLSGCIALQILLLYFLLKKRDLYM